MIIEPKVRGFICTTAHPTGAAAEVDRQIEWVRSREPIVDGPKIALVIGSSMGYGLSTRIAVAFGCSAATLGVQLERPASDPRTATAGWYNTAAFQKRAREAGLWAETINGDAFSAGVKAEAIDRLRELGPVDLVVYSLAAPRRTMPDGTVAKSVLKPLGSVYRNKTIEVATGEVSEVAIEPSTSEQEISDTVKVMGGEDWALWIDALEEAGMLAEGCRTVAYSYIGPELTFPVYRMGTIGRAKDHLEATAKELDQRLAAIGGRAFVSVNKAVVTQSSSAVPVVPLYMSLLFGVMKRKGLQEGCIEQAVRLLEQRLYQGGEIPVDAEGRIRLDDWEMRDDVQAEVRDLWERVDSDNVQELADLTEYQKEFLLLFGFGAPGVDYSISVDPDVEL
ncbi:MAG: trans-2-enoyl-CoA reductase family protein [Thermoanaerobaculia bacterium]|nr:trans-2-enoyl-CoA reductase family protein [Thermoanaerobaculia bacterium]